MKKLGSAAPALFFLVNLIYPAYALFTLIYGLRRTAPLYNVLVPVVAILSIVLGILWFAFSSEGSIEVNAIHVIFAVLAPALSFINGMCFLKADSSRWTQLLVTLMWIEAAHLPMGCFSLASGKRLRTVAMLAACAGAMAAAVWIIYPLFAQQIFAVSLFERIF